MMNGKEKKKSVIVKEIKTYPCTYLHSPYTKDCEEAIKQVTKNPLVRRRLRHNFFPITYNLKQRQGRSTQQVNNFQDAMQMADRAPDENMAILARNIFSNFKFENGQIVPEYHDDEAVDCIDNYVKFAAADVFNM